MAIKADLIRVLDEVEEKQLASLLSDFEEKAKQLNAASDSINSIITDIERKLVDANAGLECWLEDSPLLITEPTIRNLEEPNGDPAAISRWTETQLGFAKLSQAEGWRIVVRLRESTAVAAFDGEEPPEPSHQFSRVEALWKAPRNIRIKALGLMPRLVRELRNATADALKVIERAKKLK